MKAERVFTIVRVRPPQGEGMREGLWYIGIELRAAPPYEVGVLRPYILACCMKVLDLGEPCIRGGRAMKKLGGWVRWVCPLGLVLRVVRYHRHG